ncbi:hypothetical protein [Neorhodopirellula lusitana]|nr:hypothetical protein [Neorhodopirellula lusitana]
MTDHLVDHLAKQAAVFASGLNQVIVLPLSPKSVSLNDKLGWDECFGT